MTSDLYGAQLDSFTRMAKKGLRLEGSYSFDSEQLQTFSSSTSGIRTTVLVCSDVSGIQMIDTSGNDVTSSERSERLPLQLVFVSNKSLDRLLLARSDVWSGVNFC